MVDPEKHTNAASLAEELANQAKSSTVTKKRLMGGSEDEINNKSYLPDSKYFVDILSFLEENEVPQYLFPLTQGLLVSPPLEVESGAEREKLINKNKGGVIAVTNKYVRIHSVAGEWTIPYDSIVSVDFVGHPSLHIQTSGRTYYIRVAGSYFDLSEQVSEAASYIRNKEEENDDDPEADPLDKLERLGELRNNGIISEDEFENKKSNLLDEI